MNVSTIVNIRLIMSFLVTFYDGPTKTVIIRHGILQFV